MKKQLFRSRNTKIIGGVAGGVADYFDIDPVLVRAIFIIAIFGAGVSILVYIVLWIIVPVEPIGATENSFVNTDASQPDFTTVPDVPEVKRQRRHIFWGWVLIVIGLLWIVDNFIPDFELYKFWPVVLIAVGVLLLFRKTNY